MNAYIFTARVHTGTEAFRSAAKRMIGGTVVAHETEQQSIDAARALADDLHNLITYFPPCISKALSGTCSITIVKESRFAPTRVIMIGDVIEHFECKYLKNPYEEVQS